MGKASRRKRERREKRMLEDPDNNGGRLNAFFWNPEGYIAARMKERRRGIPAMIAGAAPRGSAMSMLGVQTVEEAHAIHTAIVGVERTRHIHAMIQQQRRHEPKTEEG